SAPDQGQMANVQDDGSFRFGPLVPGRYELVLTPALSGNWIPHEPPEVSVPLASIELPADRDVERSFDLREAAPGGLDVHVDASGPLRGQLSLFAISPDGSAELGSAAVEAGTAHLDALLGRQVKLVLAADGWVDPQPGLVDVPCWGRAETRLALHVLE